MYYVIIKIRYAYYCHIPRNGEGIFKVYFLRTALRLMMAKRWFAKQCNLSDWITVRFLNDFPEKIVRISKQGQSTIRECDQRSWT